jgi:hypothetical protein
MHPASSSATKVKLIVLRALHSRGRSRRSQRQEIDKRAAAADVLV